MPGPLQVCLAPALSLAHGWDLLLPPCSSAQLLRGCGMVLSSEGMAHAKVLHGLTPHRPALSLARGWSWWWHPKAHYPQNPMYLNTSQQLQNCTFPPSSFNKTRRKYWFYFLVCHNMLVWGPLSHLHCQ